MTRVEYYGVLDVGGKLPKFLKDKMNIRQPMALQKIKTILEKKFTQQGLDEGKGEKEKEEQREIQMGKFKGKFQTFIFNQRGGDIKI